LFSEISPIYLNIHELSRMTTTVTLRKVAELAEVSIGTASQALNNHPGVSPETRVRVMDAATALGYKIKISRPAQVVANGQVSVVGMLTKHDIGTPVTINDFYCYVQAGVERECRERNVSLMYANIEVDESNRPVQWPAMISNRQVDGLILIGAFIDTVDFVKRQIDIPIVLVDSYAPQLAFDSIVTDNIGGATLAMNHLIELGHRHIGLVGANDHSPPSILERREGYIRTLQHAGIAERYIEESVLSQPGGYEATLRLLRRSPQITGLFACNDLTALGALDAIRELGLRVPEDISIIGFDNIDLAKDNRPALSTIHIHKTWLGTMGLRRLIERAQDPDQPTTTTMLATQLIVRDSTRAPRDWRVEIRD
jgi:LacI family transcriptional regulator